MMKLHRSTLFAGLMAFGLVACGDDVQVVDPPPLPPPPLVVSMSPQNQQILVDETADFAINISGGAEGADITWTCTSQNINVASDATEIGDDSNPGCRVTGEGVGSTVVTASVTKGTQSASVGGQITVSQIPVEPATISIQQLTQNSAGGGIVSAPIGAIRGQLNVIMNVAGNDETPTEVSVYLGGTKVASQTLSAGAFAEAGVGPDGVLLPVTIELSFQTDRYDGMIIGEIPTGDAWHLNGLQNIQAFLEVSERPDEPSASNIIELTLANFNRIHISEVGLAAYQTKLPTAKAIGTTSGALPGQLWYGGSSGSVFFQAAPVIYQPEVPGGLTARSIAAPNGSLNVGLPGCAADVAAPYGVAPFNFTFPCAGFESGVAGVAPAILGVPIDKEGNPLVFGGAVIFPVPNIVPAIVGPHPFPINIDNKAPTGQAIDFRRQASIENRENWGNETYGLATGYTAPVDGGVGLNTTSASQVRRFRVRTGAIVVYTGSYGESPCLGLTTGPPAEGCTPNTGIAKSANNTTYNAQVEVHDFGLENTSSWTSQSLPTGANAPCAVEPTVCELTASNAASHTLTTFGYDPDDPSALYTTVGGATALGPLFSTVPFPPSIPAMAVDGQARQYVFETVPAGANFEFSATDMISGFAAPGAPGGSRALLHSHVTATATVNSPLGVFTGAGIGHLLGTALVPANVTPFGTSKAGTGFVNSPLNTGAYVQTPTSITTAAAPAVLVNGGVVATPTQEVYQARARDRAGNLTLIIAWHVYTNNTVRPIFTGLIAQGLFFGGTLATFPGTSQDGDPGATFGNEVYEASFDLSYLGMANLVYERAVNSALKFSTLFDDFILMPQPINFTTGAAGATATSPAFIRALQPVTGVVAAVSPDGEPVAGGTPAGVQVKPSIMTGRAYNGTLEGLALSPLPVPIYPCHAWAGAVLAASFRPCHITDGAPMAASATGTSAHAGATILSTQVETGTAFSGAVGPLNIANFYIAEMTVSAPSGSAPNVVRTATIKIRARGPTITFANPFPGGLVVVENLGTLLPGPVGPYYRPIAGATASPTPLFAAGFPTLDNGSIRDFDWTFSFTLPVTTVADGLATNGSREIRVIGLSGGFDGLVSSGAQVPFHATTALTTAVGIMYVP
ncbi:MAG: hypothetical protein WEG36_01075 [Gemmatimonadota bacterium]